MKPPVDRGWYEFWSERQTLCFICGRRRPTQFHHFALAGSDKYRGVAPRRSSTYNTAYVCDYCHDRVHDQAGERVVIEEMGGYLELYRRFFRMFHDYATELLAR